MLEKQGSENINIKKYVSEKNIYHCKWPKDSNFVSAVYLSTLWMKLLFLIPFQLEAVKRKSQWPQQAGSNVLELRTIMEVAVKFSCLVPSFDWNWMSIFFTWRRQVQPFSNCIIFVAYLVSFLASVLYGHLK